MRAFFLTVSFCLSVFATDVPARADEATTVSTIPIKIQYARTGLEDWKAAEELGKAEEENGNPCVSKMRRELEAHIKSETFRKAVEVVVRNSGVDPRPKPSLVLRYMNDSMELRLELRSLPVKDDWGTVVAPERVIERKGVVLSGQQGNWKDRMDRKLCTFTAKNAEAFNDELLEATRLKECVTRKVELIRAAQKVTNYIHNYLPATWIDEARRKLAEQKFEVTGVLRQDQSIYRESNGTFRECAHGLKLLEDEAAASVRVLNEMKAANSSTDMPVKEIEDLERRLASVPVK